MQDILSSWNVITTVYTPLQYGHCYLKQASGAEDQLGCTGNSWNLGGKINYMVYGSEIRLCMMITDPWFAYAGRRHEKQKLN